MRALQFAGMAVQYDYEFNVSNNGHDYSQIADATVPGPIWLRSLLGDDFFRTVVFVYFDNTPIKNADLKHLDGLPEIRSLSLCGTQITDAGLEDLKGLRQLRFLLLRNTSITDTGLDHLAGLIQLRQLDLVGTRVTATGIKKLQQALPECFIQGEPPTNDGPQGPAAPDQLR